MARELKFAVLGLGVGIHHCAAIANAKGAVLAAVCDRDPERLTAAVKQYDVPGYTKLKDLLNDKQVDAVCVCTESGTHTKYGARIAQAGKHIVMEKPVDIRLDRVDAFKKTVKKSGIKCACVLQLRLEPLNVALKAALDAGHIGKLIGAHAALPWLREDAYFAGPHGTWKGTWKLDGGGSLMNQGIHTVDLLQWLAGPVKSVFGYSGVFNHKIEAEDQVVAVLKFKNGALGTLYTTTCTIPEGKQRFHFYGTGGSFTKVSRRLEQYDMGPPKDREKMMLEHGGPEKRKTVTPGKNPMSFPIDGHTLIMEDLAKAVRDNREPMIDIDSTRHSIEIALAIYKACRTGKEVRL